MYDDDYNSGPSYNRNGDRDWWNDPRRDVSRGTV